MSNQTTPTTRTELHAAMDDLLSEAHENGVAVHNHSYPLRHNNPKLPDWEVIVTQVSKK